MGRKICVNKVAMELSAKTMEEAVRLEEPCGLSCTVDTHR